MPAGRAIVQGNLVATALFAVTAAYAAISYSTLAQWVGAVTALALFTVGVFAFLTSFWTAVQSSREREIAVTQLYLLMGRAIPARIRRTMNLVLVAQFTIALVTTLIRPNHGEGAPGSSLAVGFLVPMLGFGLNGLWASRHGSFAARRDLDARAGDHVAERGTQVPASDDEIGQNAPHG
jgi:hypothetical protein